MANSIYKFIKVEVDYPSLQPGRNMVPILDLEVGVVDNKLTQFYRKKMANFFVLMERSAMPDRQKRVSLVQEVVRILRNTNQDLPMDLRNSFVSEFSLRLKMSGYSKKFRYEVISSAMACYEKLLKRALEGTCPLYRPKGYKEEERRRKKHIKKRSWYKPFSTILFCPPSPNSELAQKLRKNAKEETENKGWSAKW